MLTKQLSDSSYAFLERILLSKSLLILEDNLDEDQCRDFWCSEDVVEWFKAQGYTPYKRDTDRWGDPSLRSSPSLPYPVFQEADYPFAYHHTDGGSKDALPLSVRNHSARMIFAQDENLRHVAIKAMHIKSKEYRIAQFLNQFPPETLRESCILPAVGFIHFRDACFLVMPRWGSGVRYPLYHSLRDLLLIMKSVSKALVFLHSHKIIHRDLRFDNFVVNHFGNDSNVYWQRRMPQLLEGSLTYALIDFDVSNLLPSTTDPKTFRLPYQEAFIGNDGPNDIAQGEFDYNPFAYDVGCLGYLFCYRYQHHARDLPLLAPLLDMMITPDTSKRFTAEEALQFVDKILIEADPAQLSVYETEYMGGLTYEDYDRWEGLPLEFKKKWASYRIPVGVPFTSRILRDIVDSERLPRSTVPWIRWLFSSFFSLPRKLWTTLFRFI